MLPEFWFSPWLVQLIGWAIIHSVWQGAIIALSLALALRILQKSASHVRYALACAALALMFVCPVATSLWLNSSLSNTATSSEKINQPPDGAEEQRLRGKVNDAAVAAEEELFPGANSGFEKTLNFTVQAERFFPWIIMFWTFGVLIFSIRLSAGFFYTRRFIKFAAAPSGSLVEKTLDELLRRLNIKKQVKVLESVLVKIPMTVGWLSPVILLPPSALLGLTPQQLQSILAHELVHIKRCDFLVNILQTIVETLLFYHPAARWVSGKIRKEREFVCDDLTLALCGDALVYARALTKVARFGGQSDDLAMAATRGDLSSRIYRLLGKTRPPAPANSSYFYGVFIAGFIFLTVAAALTINSEFGQNASLADRISPEANKTNLSARKNEGNVQSSDNDRLKIYGDDLSKENLQYRKIAVEALEAHKGSVIIMNPQTGQVQTIVNQEQAFRRGWSPASVFKIVTSVAGIEENVLKDSEKGFGYDATGWRTNLTQALAVSDSDYFKSVASEVGSESLIKYARLLGLGAKTGINYGGEIDGYVPETINQKNERLGIAGGEIEVTPLQLAVLISTFANGGKIFVPQAASDNQNILPQVREQILVSKNTLTEIRKGLREAVKNGTGNDADNPATTVAGKTGTAISEDNAAGLFVSYAPEDNPKFVIVVALEGKNETGRIAAQIAGKIYTAL